MKIVVLGGTGMLGHQLFFTGIHLGLDIDVIARNRTLLLAKTRSDFYNRIHICQDVKDFIQLEKTIKGIKPDVLINCIGIVKQSHLSNNYIESITINSLLPHYLEQLGTKYNYKLIHISTDCVFDGSKGMYKEADSPNATDLYGKSKNLGEVDYGSGLTIRTSIIGHEITKPTHGVIEWFLSEDNSIEGYKKAIFSGLTTYELSIVIFNTILKSDLSAGLYHVAGNPISKYDLLSLTAEIYNKQIRILPSDQLVIDRSLNPAKFAGLTGYVAPSWQQMIQEMKENNYTKYLSI